MGFGDNNDNNKDNFIGNEQTFQDFEFDSYAFDDFSGSLSNNEVSSINVEEYAFQELDLDAKYRSIQTVNPSQSLYSAPALNSMAPPQLSKGSSSSQVNKNQLMSKAPLSVVTTKSSSKPVLVPEKPLQLAVTHFSSFHNINTVISMIEYELSKILEVSFEFYHEKCRWECVYLCGATRCKFEFNVYKNGDGSYLIEGNRLCGESFPFSTLYRTLRTSFSDDINSSPKSVTNFQFIPLPESVVELSSEEVMEAVAPVLAMADSGKLESQVTAAQIFCDLSLQQNMNEVLCQQNCISSLVGLTKVEFNYCNQHAVCALANLSSSRSCQEVLLRNDKFLVSLLHLCCLGDFNTAEMRRECARLLANVCSSSSSCAAKFVQAVGEEEVSRWCSSVATFTDERLKLHAERASGALRACLA